MMQTYVTLSIFVTVLALAGVTQAGTISLSVGSSKPIVHSMDLAVNRGSFTYLYTQGQSRIDTIYKNQKPPDTLRLKNPNIALLIAIVPGFAVHGAGHFYARRPVTAVVLFGVEIIGSMFVFGSALEGWDTGSSEHEGRDAVIGMILFLGSWAYDLIGAPLTISNENERIFEKQAALKHKI